MVNMKDSARKAQILKKATVLSYTIMVTDTEGITKMTKEMDLVFGLIHLVLSILVSTKTTKDQAKESYCMPMAIST